MTALRKNNLTTLASNVLRIWNKLQKKKKLCQMLASIEVRVRFLVKGSTPKGRELTKYTLAGLWHIVIINSWHQKPDCRVPGPTRLNGFLPNVAIEARNVYLLMSVLKRCQPFNIVAGVGFARMQMRKSLRSVRIDDERAEIIAHLFGGESCSVKFVNFMHVLSWGIFSKLSQLTLWQGTKLLINFAAC